jgi:hypothetical protein
MVGEQRDSTKWYAWWAMALAGAGFTLVLGNGRCTNVPLRDGLQAFWGVVLR